MAILLRPLVFAVVLLSASTAFAIDRQQAELSARESFAAGRYPEALALFAKLYAETLHPVYLRNIGRCHQKMRNPDAAIDSFRDYLAKSKRLPAAERVEIDGYIKEMEALRAEQARVKDLSSTAASPPLTPPPPPPTTPPVTLAVAPTAPATAPAQPTPAVSLVASPAPEPSPPIYKRWWFWTGVGAVIAGGVVTALVLSSGGTRPNCALPRPEDCM